MKIEINRTKEEANALNSGATLMIEIIPVKIEDSTTSSSFNLAQTLDDGTLYMTTTSEVIRKYSPLQKDDIFSLRKDRKHFEGKITNIRLKRVLDLTIEECVYICGVSDYKYCYNTLNKRYRTIFPLSLDIALDNPYLFMYTIEKLN